MIASLFLVIAVATKLDTGVTPVQKVIEMMKEMKAKGEAEMDAEQKTWHEYSNWCKDTSKEKDFSIRTANRDIERLQASIQKAEAKAAELADKLAALDADVATWSGDLQAATALRKKEHEDYKVNEKDYSESIDALGRAISVLSAQQGDTAQAAMFLQKLAVLKRVPKGTQQQIVSLLEMDQAPSGAPAAAAYESQSGGVVEMLEDLASKFKEEYDTLVKDEAQAKHNYEMMALNLNNEIKAAKKESAAKAEAKLAHEEQAAEDKADLADTQAAKASDEKYLKELVTQCDLKQEAFDARQKLRGEELEALQQAIDIIADEAVSGAADKHLPSFAQKTSLALLRATVSGSQLKAAQLLAESGLKLGSKQLSFLALKAGSDPMEKVRQMIRDLIAKLQQEAAEEAEHKAWCDGELHDNKVTRDEKTEQVDTLRATVEQLTAEIGKLTEEIAALNKAVAELDAALAEATELRAQEKAKNKNTIKDAQAALSAVKSAMQVLKKFYAKAATATALTQGPADDAPGSWEEPYKGMGGSSKGVIGMLEVIESDFARLESETTADENQAQKEFEEFSETSLADKEAKVGEAKAKGKLVTKKERELGDAEKDLKATQEELDAALAYYDELKPACLEAGVSYEERVKQREAELQSLNEAWEILDAHGKD
jgi:DNA repair exonuclease SbcCD ATPase subunit